MIDLILCLFSIGVFVGCCLTIRRLYVLNSDSFKYMPTNKLRPMALDNFRLEVLTNTAEKYEPEVQEEAVRRALEMDGIRKVLEKPYVLE